MHGDCISSKSFENFFPLNNPTFFPKQKLVSYFNSWMLPLLSEFTSSQTKKSLNLTGSTCIMLIWDVIFFQQKVEFCKLESHSFGEDPKLIWFPFFFLHCQLQPEYLLLLLTFELLFCDLLLLIVISLFIFQNTATRQWPCRHPSYSCFPLFSLWCCNKHSPRTI